MPDQIIPSPASNAAFRVGNSSGALLGSGLPGCSSLAPMVERQLAACRRNGSSLALLSIALERFDAVAACHGDVIAGLVLQAVWNRLRSHLRGSDLAVRVGDAEFGAILRNAGWPAAVIVEARLSAALSQLYGIGALDIQISTRIGQAVYPRHGATGEALVETATSARESRIRM